MCREQIGVKMMENSEEGSRSVQVREVDGVAACPRGALLERRGRTDLREVLNIRLKRHVGSHSLKSHRMLGRFFCSVLSERSNNRSQFP